MNEQFVRSMWPHAVRVSQQTGIDPRLVIAQSALETGWGKSAPGNNYFGIKSHGKPGGQALTTQEWDGQAMRTLTDSFATYSDMGASVDGYAQFLMENPRYQGVLSAQGLDAQINAMGASGYATDPNYTQKLRSIAGMIPAGMGGPEYIETVGLESGSTPSDVVSRRANYGIIDSAIMNSPAFAPMSDPVLASSGAMGPSVGPDPMQAAPEGERDPWGFLEKLMPGMTMDQRNDRLLAIGAGLLSGTNWNDGFAAAAQNLMGINQTEDERAFTMERDLMNAALDAQAREQSASSAGYERIGSVMTPDGRIVGGVSYDPQTATFFTMGPNGREDIPGAIPLNNSDASGSRFATLATKERDAAAEAAGTLRTVDRVLANLQNSPTGLEGAVSDVKRAFNTIVGMGITPEQMARGLTQAEIQGLVGKFKDEVVGGGTMTEQDAARIVLSLGGDLQSIMSNPQIMTERLQTLRGDAQRRYDRHFNQYETYRTQFPYMPLDPLERYEGPATSTGGAGNNADVEDFLRKEGILP